MKSRMKKTVCLLFTAVLLTMGLVTAVSADFTDVYDSDTAYAVSVLEALDVVEGFPDGTYRPEETLTRAQFCKLTVQMLGLEHQAASAAQKTLFSDVPSSHWAVGYINLAHNNGYIQGYGDGRFGPDDTLTYAQAATILLRVLGYTADDIGDYYPDDYVRFAEDAGLNDGIDLVSEQIMVRGDTALLLYNVLGCNTKSGTAFVKNLSSESLDSAILLDDDSTSPEGLMNCVKLYSGGQAVWYTKANTVTADMVGYEGDALIDENGELIAFLPDDTCYTIYDGVLISGNTYTEDWYGTGSYNVELYTGGETVSFPRANSISANLIGNTGTLILNEHGYATAFISDDTAVYNITADAILLDNDAVSDKGYQHCAEFYVNGKSVWYKQNDMLSDSLIGCTGTVLYDDNNTVIEFSADAEEDHTVRYGVLLEADSDEATFIMDGELVEYNLSVTLSANTVGQKGRILLNEQEYVTAFLTDGDSGYSITEDAVLLDNDATSDDGTRHCAKFYVNGKTVWYEQAYELDYSYVGCSGTVLYDEDGNLIAFVTDGENEYIVGYGTLLEIDGNYGVFYLDGERYECRISDSITAASVGKSGTILLNARGKVMDFLTDGGNAYSVSQEGILLANDATAVDGRTDIVKIYIGGKIVTYRLAGRISDRYIGEYGKLVLDEDDNAVDFIEGDTNCDRIEIDDSYTKETFEDAYEVTGSIPVIWDGDVLTWKDISLGEGETMSMIVYYNSVGSVDVIVIEE